jgi:hypothetical protein
LGIPYRPQWRDRIRNYLIAYDELGLDPSDLVAHFEQFLGAEQARPLVESSRREIAGPFHYFDAVYSLSSDPSREPWSALALDGKVRVASAPVTPSDPAIGHTLGLRALLDEARRQDLEHVLVFDADFVPSSESLETLCPWLSDLRAGNWLISRHGKIVAYRQAIFGPLLQELPETPAGIALWLKRGNRLEVIENRLAGNAT